MLTEKRFHNLVLAVAGIVIVGTVALAAVRVWSLLAAPPAAAVSGRLQPSPYGLGAHSVFLRIDAPLPTDKLASPVRVSGAARTWYFEGSFPVEIRDANGLVLGSASAQAQGDWMTDEFVPFDLYLSFSAPATDTGTLIFRKDNPSGLPQFDEQVSVPVFFRR